jgi:acyl carrier protein
MKEAKAFIMDFFAERSKLPSGDQEQFITQNYIEQGLLDSIDFITLISELEEQYGIAFSQEQIQSEAFRTIKGLSSMVNELSKAAS